MEKTQIIVLYIKFLQAIRNYISFLTTETRFYYKNCGNMDASGTKPSMETKDRQSKVIYKKRNY